MKFIKYILFLVILVASNCLTRKISTQAGCDGHSNILCNTASQDPNVVAAWFFDKVADNGNFSDIKSGLNLTIAPAPNTKSASTTKKRLKNKISSKKDKSHIKFHNITPNSTISYLDFKHSDLATAVLYHDPKNSTLHDTFKKDFSMIVIFNTDGNGSGGAFLAGQWEEFDRSRTFALFGNLMNGKLTAHISHTGNASPGVCDYAWEKVTHDTKVIDKKWHTAAIVWKSNPNASDDSPQTKATECVKPKTKKRRENEEPGISTYKCNNETNCSEVKVYLDNLGSKSEYYNYQKLYDQYDLNRTSLFTVGGGFAKSCHQPDSGKTLNVNEENLILTTTFKKNELPVCSENDNWRLKDNEDWYTRKRFYGGISAIIIFNKPISDDDFSKYNTTTLYSK